MCICVYAYIHMCLYICVCTTIIIKEKEAVNLRLGGTGWERLKGEDLKVVEGREGESDVVIF